MFARSLDLVDECGLTHLHVFPFSPRPGTPAARMPQVARDVVKERARRLREKGAAALARHLDGEVGARRRVLIESQRARPHRAVHAGAARGAGDRQPAIMLDVDDRGPRRPGQAIDWRRYPSLRDDVAGLDCRATESTIARQRIPRISSPP